MQRLDLNQVSQHLSADLDSFLDEYSQETLDVKIYNLLEIFSLSLKIVADGVGITHFDKIAFYVNSFNRVDDSKFNELDRAEKNQIREIIRTRFYFNDILKQFRNEFPEERNIPFDCAASSYAFTALHALFCHINSIEIDAELRALYKIFFDRILPCFPEQKNPYDIELFCSFELLTLYGSYWYDIFIYKCTNNYYAEFQNIEFKMNDYRDILKDCLNSSLSDIEKFIVINSAWNSFKPFIRQMIADDFLSLMAGYAVKGSIAASYWIVTQPLFGKNKIQSNNFAGIELSNHLSIIINAISFPAIDFTPTQALDHFCGLINFYLSKNLMTETQVNQCVRKLKTSSKNTGVEFAYLQNSLINCMEENSDSFRMDKVLLSKYRHYLENQLIDFVKKSMSDQKCHPFLKAVQKNWFNNCKNNDANTMEENVDTFLRLSVCRDSLFSRLPNEMIARIACESRNSHLHSSEEATKIINKSFS